MYVLLMALGCGGDSAEKAKADKIARMPSKGKRKKKGKGGNKKGRKRHGVRNSPLQGAWVVDDGGPKAWDMSGHMLRVYNGKTELTYKINVQYPCRLEVVDGPQQVWYGVTLDEHSQPYIGKHPAGVVQGDTAMFCSGKDVWLYQNSRCQSEIRPGATGSCGPKGGEWQLDGTLLEKSGVGLFHPDMKNKKALAFDDYETAKRYIDGDKTAKPRDKAKVRGKMRQKAKSTDPGKANKLFE